MGQSWGYGAGHRNDGSCQPTDDCGWHCVLCARYHLAGADKMKVIFLALLSTTVVLILASASMRYVT